jgi:hypothetical protein
MSPLLVNVDGKKSCPYLISADGIDQSAFAKCGLGTLVIFDQTVLVSCF